MSSSDALPLDDLHSRRDFNDALQKPNLVSLCYSRKSCLL